MDAQAVAAIVGLVTLVSIAAWRFSRVETVLKIVVRNQEDQHSCQHTMSKELVRVNANLKTVKSVLMRHLKQEEAK
ncbi:hypothetical protein LCGC14_0805010 [marine sediment metagenome]|uniref:Uncharacterized protein n=1 Tax=marine sediment metagenome TaxID=412755 RepID=A0A0F9PNI3_9ZZZZ